MHGVELLIGDRRNAPATLLRLQLSRLLALPTRAGGKVIVNLPTIISTRLSYLG